MRCVYTLQARVDSSTSHPTLSSLLFRLLSLTFGRISNFIRKSYSSVRLRLPDQIIMIQIKTNDSSPSRSTQVHPYFLGELMHQDSKYLQPDQTGQSAPITTSIRDSHYKLSFTSTLDLFDLDFISIETLFLFSFPVDWKGKRAG